MVKDRLGDLKARRPSIFKSIKESIRRKSFRRRNTLGNFLEDVNAIDAALASLKEGVAETKRLQATVLGVPASDKQPLAQLARSNARNRELSAEVRTLIHELSRNHAPRGGAGGQPGERTPAGEQVVRNQLERLTAALAEMVQDWHAAQAAYGDKVKERLRREYSIAGEAKSERELSEMLATSDGTPRAVFTQDIIREMRDAQAMLDQVQAREKEILQLERSVVQVHELFAEMQGLVGEQGEALGRVETRVEAAREDVSAGAAKLKQAKLYKAKSRRKRFVIAGIVVVAVLLIGGIIALVVLV